MPDNWLLCGFDCKHQKQEMLQDGSYRPLADTSPGGTLTGSTSPKTTKQKRELRLLYYQLASRHEQEQDSSESDEAIERKEPMLLAANSEGNFQGAELARKWYREMRTSKLGRLPAGEVPAAFRIEITAVNRAVSRAAADDLQLLDKSKPDYVASKFRVKIRQILKPRQNAAIANGLPRKDAKSLIHSLVRIAERKAIQAGILETRNGATSASARESHPDGNRRTRVREAFKAEKRRRAKEFENLWKCLTRILGWYAHYLRGYHQDEKQELRRHMAAMDPIRRTRSATSLRLARQRHQKQNFSNFGSSRPCRNQRKSISRDR